MSSPIKWILSLLVSVILIFCFVTYLDIGWEKTTGNLPNKLGKLTLIRKGAHAFLAEYNRKIRITFHSGESETITLPMNTGGRTNIRVFLISKENEQCIRLKDHNYLNMVISLASLKIVEEINYPEQKRIYPEEGEFIGAFMAVTTELIYVDLEKDRMIARKCFQESSDRGYKRPLESLNELEGEKMKAKKASSDKSKNHKGFNKRLEEYRKHKE